MSAITAIFGKSGTVRSDEFEAVFDALSHRNWDGADSVVRDRVALGHQHAYRTPEEVGEQQPIALGDHWITLDGRIDNRGEMLALVDDDDLSESSSDAEIALGAYRALGTEFLDHLVGAFVLSIWDPSNERLLIARDKTGIRKLYYADWDDRVVVASEMQAIRKHPDVSSGINERFVGEFLATDFLPEDETFHSDIRSVVPGSFVEVTADGIRTESYWRPWDADLDLDLDDPEDAADEFRRRFEKAVACRLRSQELPGIMLSGGLDSTAIACVADRYLDESGESDVDLHSFTKIIEGVDFFEDEIDRLDAVVEQCDIESHRITANDHFTLKDVDLYEHHAHESPAVGPVIQATGRLFEKASDAGHTVLIGGYSGNLYDGNRFSYYDLLRDRRFLTFGRHLLADPVSLRRLLLWFVLVPASDRIAEFVRNWYDEEFDDEIPVWIDTDFAQRHQLSEPRTADIDIPFDSISREMLFKLEYLKYRRFELAAQRRLALEAGVDLRSPYLDARLVEFLFSVPTYELFSAGESKALFRRAMKGILPEIVRTQKAFVHFDPIINLGIRDERSQFVEELFTDSKLSELGIVDDEAFSEHVSNYLDHGDEMGTIPFWNLISLELWLRQWA